MIIKTIVICWISVLLSAAEGSNNIGIPPTAFLD